MKVKVKKLRPEAVLPTYATAGSACFDLFAVEKTIIGPNATRMIPTGLAFELPHDHVMMLFLRSSMSKRGFVSNTGIIDSDYRGEVFFPVSNVAGGYLFVGPGDRLGQAMIIPRPRVEFEEVEELTQTERGSGGFGSTGK